MVFVGVGEHETDDVASFRDQEADVRQDEIDAGQVFFAAERNAAIDDQPLSAGTVAKAVDREIHPDLTNAAKRGENELQACHQTVPVMGNTSPAAIASSEPSGSRSNRRPWSSSPSPRPIISLSGRRARMSPPMPAARAVQSARISGKPPPRRHCASRRAMLAVKASNSASTVTATPSPFRSVTG